MNYILCTGNHDYGENGSCNNRETKFSSYFDYMANSDFISSYEENEFENSYFQFYIHNQAYQLFALEFGPRDKILDWADSIANANPDRTAIVLTHAYLEKDEQRFNFEKYGFTQTESPVAYGISILSLAKMEPMMESRFGIKLIMHNFNVRFVFSGHKSDPDFIGNLKSMNKDNKTVYQFMFNTQRFLNGGFGWIQIFEFKKDTGIIEIRTLSTYKKKWFHDSKSEFQFQLD